VIFFIFPIFLSFHFVWFDLSLIWFTYPPHIYIREDEIQAQGLIFTPQLTFKIAILNSIIFTKGTFNAKEYTREFEKFVIKCDLQEPEEQTIVRYLGGLDPRYANVVELQAYTTFDEVCMLAYKVEQQKKSRHPPKPQNPKPFTRNQPRGVLSLFPSPKLHPLPFYKEPKLHKRLKPLKINSILTL